MIRYICLSTALSLNRNAAHRPIQREHYASASSAWECLNSDTGGALVARARGSWLRESITSETFVRWPTNTTSASAAPKASAPLSSHVRPDYHQTPFTVQHAPTYSRHNFPQTLPTPPALHQPTSPHPPIYVCSMSTTFILNRNAAQRLFTAGHHLSLPTPNHLTLPPTPTSQLTSHHSPTNAAQHTPSHPDQLSSSPPRPIPNSFPLRTRSITVHPPKPSVAPRLDAQRMCGPRRVAAWEAQLLLKPTCCTPRAVRPLASRTPRCTPR